MSVVIGGTVAVVVVLFIVWRVRRHAYGRNEDVLVSWTDVHHVNRNPGRGRGNRRTL